MHRYCEARDGLRSSVMANLPGNFEARKSQLERSHVPTPRTPVNNASFSLILGLDAHTQHIKASRCGNNPTCLSLYTARSKHRRTLQTYHQRCQRFRHGCTASAKGNTSEPDGSRSPVMDFAIVRIEFDWRAWASPLMARCSAVVAALCTQRLADIESSYCSW